jgi:type IV pilus assembly protein PilY1
MGEVKTLRTNAIGVRHPYLTDGSAVAYLEDTNINGTIDAGEAAYLFFGLRRGGKNYYALDISDPENPDLLWSIDKSGDFAELGNTFSTPRVIKVDTGSGPQPALIFAGGYDMNKDLRGGVGTNDSEGNAIFIVDAETGKLIWKAIKGASTGSVSSKIFEHTKLTDSIPSTVSLLDSDGDTLHDRAYVGDTGGNVWRVDFYGSDTSKWKLSLLATVGRHSAGASGKADDRRFFHRPDVVQNFDQTGPYDAVIIGTGDRTDPLDAGGTADNWVYMIKDRAFKAGSGGDTAQTHSSFGDVTNTCLLKDGACTADLSNGWALELTAGGEKALATATTLGGTVYFSTYLPPGSSNSGSCGPAEGNGRLYAISLTDAHARNNYDTTTDEEERFEELESQGVPSEVVTLPPDTILRPDLVIEKTNAPTRVQTYWFESEDSDL